MASQAPVMAQDIAASLQKQLDAFAPKLQAVDVGTVLEAGDGIARVSGLAGVQASEHSARMVAMRNATDSAQDLAGALTLRYNKARQQGITSELLDIAGCAEALAQAVAA